MTPRSPVHLCGSSTPTYMDLIFLVPLFITCVRGTRIVVTPNIVSDVLCVPRVEHPDYLGCDRLKTVSKDELISSFCERPSDWRKRQFTYCLGFTKGSRFPNMVMTFSFTSFISL